MSILTRTGGLALALVALAAPAADAAGFALFEQGARAQGFAGAFTAIADDPSALFHNAGGLAFLDGKHFYVGATSLAPKTDFTGADPFPGATVTEQMDVGVITIPSIYYTHQFSERVVLGASFNTPFGLRTEWANPDTYSGRFLSQMAELQGFSVNPTIGWKAADRFGIGVGLDVRVSSVNLERRAPARHPVTGAILDAAQVTLESDRDVAFGFNVGVLAKPTENFSVGAQYRHKVKHEYTGTATFSLLPTGIPPLDAAIAQALPSRPVNVTTGITFPSIVTTGAAYKFTDWTVALDVDWYQWSTFDQLVIDFEGLPHLRNVIPERYEDSFQVRVGAERRFGRAWAARGGYYYDQTPSPVESVTPLLPDADRHGAALGGSWASGHWRIDGAAWFIFSKDRSTDGLSREGYNGLYETRTTTAALFFGYVF